jgi:two-component system, NtrC family, sensor kinase
VTLERRTIQLADHQAEQVEYPEGTAVARQTGVHTMLAVPLLRAGEAIGVIALRRTEVRLFTDRQIELLKTFADQAVIAIENTRLFEAEQTRTREVTERTRELSESLEQQTATSEVLRVISSTPGELEAAFQVILANAVRLCEATFGMLFRFEEGAWRAVAIPNVPSPDSCSAPNHTERHYSITSSDQDAGVGRGFSVT